MRPGSSQSMYRMPSYMRPSTAFNAKVQHESVPREFLIRDLKEKRKFRLLTRKLTVFVTFVCVYIAVLLLDRNISGRSVVRRIIANELLETSHASSGVTFSSIHSVGSFWDWVSNNLIEVVYGSLDSNGLPRLEDEKYTIASHTQIVGGFRMTQDRYAAMNVSSAAAKGDQCYSTLASTQGLPCFSSRYDSIDSFGVTNGTAASEDRLKSLEMFNYTTSKGSTGFQTFFLRSVTAGEEERQRVRLMQEFRWIDRQTRRVEITMPLYNRNLKLWSIVDLTVDFDLAGGVTPSSFVHVTNLEPYDFNNRRNVVRGVLEIVFVAHVIYFFLLELWDICVLSNGSLRVYIARYGFVNNLGDWGQIVTNGAICLWRYFCQTNGTRKQLLSLESFDEYVPAESLALWDDVLLAMNICNVLLLTARTLKYFQVTAGGRRLMYSVYGAMPEVMSFLPIYCAVIVGYTFAGHMLYGLSFREWSTFPRALFRVFELNFGLYDPGPIYDAGGYLSAIFIYSSNVVFCILMLNVFMAIVMSTWEQLSEKEAEKAQERATYSHPLTISDMVHLVLMREEVVDALLDVAMDLEGVDKVSKNMFATEWHATGVDVPPKTWERITRWYWDTSSSEGAKPQATDALVVPKKLVSSPTLGAIDDVVKIVNSPRDLGMDTEPPASRQPKLGSGPSRLPLRGPSSAKVAADLSATDGIPTLGDANKT